MSRNAIRSPLCTLLSGLMLAACGGEPEAGLAPAEEALGTQQSAICSGASVSALSLSSFNSWGGEAAGGGTWSVTYPSNGVHLDYYIDGIKRGEQELQGDANRSGSWNFSYNPVGCGSHTFEVKAYPITLHSSGVDRCPTSGPQTRTQSFSQTCPTASVSCSRTSSHQVTCTGSGSGGTGGFTPYWQESGQSAYDPTEWVLSSWDAGAWQESFFCPQTTDTYFSDRLRIEFKVRDSSGMDSSVRSTFLYCKAGMTVPY